MIERLIDFGQPGAWSKGFREALGRFVTGVTIMTTKTAASSFEGLTVNSFSALSLDPPLILWSLRNNASSYRAFAESEWFVVNVLGATQGDVSQRFATSSPNKFVGFDCACGLGGCPIIAGSIARFECRTERIVPGGDHIILIGRVERAAHRIGEPLLFYAGAYCMPAPIEWAFNPPIIDSVAGGLAIEPSHFF
jgi:flavin reductase (DIM6/NTAB) family NADH-FMN oxidoreductase RutF